MDIQKHKRETWNNQFGFIVSVVGAAIGLGNLWLFPWRLVNYDGGSFLIPYFFFVFIFVRLGLTAEAAFGRAFHEGPVGSFSKAFPQKYKNFGKLIGTIPGITLLGILIFYLVVCGWIASYTFLYFINTNKIINAPEDYFSSLSGTFFTLPGLIIIIFIVGSIILLGVKKGIEKGNKIAMPIFFTLILLLLIRSLSLSGSSKAFDYIFSFSWEYFLDPITWIMALGQGFFTVSLGGMLTYGSYLKDDTDIISASFWTVIFNSTASVLGALVIIPALFAFNMDMSSGPSLLFISIPKLCSVMPKGTYFGGIFFICALLASISSAVNLMEVASETAMSFFNISRKLATFSILAIVLVFSPILSCNMFLFQSWTFILTVFIYPFIPLIIQITFMWIYGTQNAIKQIKKGSSSPFTLIDVYILKYIFPILCIFVILLVTIFRQTH